MIRAMELESTPLHKVTPEEYCQMQGFGVNFVINYVVNRLDHITTTRDLLKLIGKIHEELDVAKIHFVYFKEAAMDVLQQNLGDKLNQEDYQAWSKMFNIMLKYFFE
ncbi:Protein of unknown function, partial [Cotesia congregata]